MQVNAFVIQMSHTKRSANLNIRLPQELKDRLTYIRKDMSEADYVSTVLAYHLRNARIISEQEREEFKREFE